MRLGRRLSGAEYTPLARRVFARLNPRPEWLSHQGFVRRIVMLQKPGNTTRINSLESSISSVLLSIKLI